MHWTIWLDVYATYRSWKTSKWRHSGWVSWQFRQTQNGYWDQHGVQCENHPETQQSCLQSKSTKTNPPESGHNRWISSHAQIWNHYSTELFSSTQAPALHREKPNRKLRLLVDLRKINNLIPDDYTNNNHPVSTVSEAAEHVALKSLFRKLDCSQACHCLQMADQRSVEMLAFSCASRAFAYKRLAQGLNRSVSAFQFSCMSIWSLFSRLNNVFNTWMILEMQPIMLRILTGTFVQSFSAFTEQDCNWKSESAILESDKLKFWGERFYQKELHSMPGI